MVPWIGIQCVIVALPDHTNLRLKVLLFIIRMAVKATWTDRTLTTIMILLRWTVTRLLFMIHFNLTDHNRSFNGPTVSSVLAITATDYEGESSENF